MPIKINASVLNGNNWVDAFRAVGKQALQHGETDKQGWGRIGYLNGKVFKFNTHRDQYNHDCAAEQDAGTYAQMRCACLQLRDQILTLTKQIFGNSKGEVRNWEANVPKDVREYLSRMGVDKDGMGRSDEGVMSNELIKRSDVGKWWLKVKKHVLEDSAAPEGTKFLIRNMRGVEASRGLETFSQIIGDGESNYIVGAVNWNVLGDQGLKWNNELKEFTSAAAILQSAQSVKAKLMALCAKPDSGFVETYNRGVFEEYLEWLSRLSTKSLQELASAAKDLDRNGGRPRTQFIGMASGKFYNGVQTALGIEFRACAIKLDTIIREAAKMEQALRENA